MPTPVNLDDAFLRVRRPWDPLVVAELNGQQVRIARLKGEFVWHRHEHEDEMFLVLEGVLRIRFRDGEEVLRPGELLVVPRGVEHQPVAEEEVRVLLFEPAGTVNTGHVRSEATVLSPRRLDRGEERL